MYRVLNYGGTVKVHGLAVRRGEVSILCNGSPNHHRGKELKNHFIGESAVIAEALHRTRESFKKHPSQNSRGLLIRYLIPQEMLGKKVTCDKCLCLMHPKAKKEYMKTVYQNSWRFKSRKKSKPSNRLEVLGRRPVGRPRKDRAVVTATPEQPDRRVTPIPRPVIPVPLRIPRGGALHLHISVV